MKRTDVKTLAVIQDWLASKHCTMWGRAFDLSQNPTLAALWFMDEMESFLSFADERTAAEAIERHQREVQARKEAARPLLGERDYRTNHGTPLPRASWDVVASSG